MRDTNEEHQRPESHTHSDEDQVARRAYELYQARGGDPGHDLEDWLQAEKEMGKHVQAIHSL